MKLLSILLSALFIWLGIYVISCGSTDKPIIIDPPPEPTTTLVLLENPVCAGDLLTFGPKSTNLWKPVSDTIWSFAFVIDSRFTQEFKQCHVELKDGTYHELECFKNNGTCFANGGRQHWKTKLPVSKVKNRAKIVCQEVKQECTWILPGRPTQRWE